MIQFNELIEPTLIALQELGGSGSNKEIVDLIIKNLNISNDISCIPHNARDRFTELEYRAAWARTYLKKVGYITNTARGIWELNKDVDIASVNADDVVAEVRKKAAEITEELPAKEITNIEKAQAFEKYVLLTLKEYLNVSDTHINYNHSYDRNFDMFIPDGIAEIEGPVYVEIKYATSVGVIRTINAYCEKAMSWIDKNKETLLFVLGTKISNKAQLEEEMKRNYEINVVIWDIDDIISKIPTFPANLEYLSSPRRTVVKELMREKADEVIKDENSKNLQALCEAYKSGRLVLCLGAGVSIDAGIPLWDELINKLLLRIILLANEKSNTSEDVNDENEKKVFTEEEIDELKEIALENKEETPLMQMRYIKTAIDEELYYEAVHSELYSNEINRNNKLLNSIAKLCRPEREHKGVLNVITYNFDNLLEQVLDDWEVGYNVIQSGGNVR